MPTNYPLVRASSPLKLIYLIFIVYFIGSNHLVMWLALVHLLGHRLNAWEVSMRSELYVMVFTKRLGLYRRARMVTFSAPSSNYYRPRSRI